MANDIDMWIDIQDLEDSGEQEQADALLDMHFKRFNEGCDDDDPKLQALAKAYKEKYGFLDNYFSH
jgi:hypothetical protein